MEELIKKISELYMKYGIKSVTMDDVSRELGIPAIVGCGDATEKIKTGTNVTVSCSEGEVGKVYEGLLKYRINRHNLKNFKKPKTEIKMIPSWMHIPARAINPIPADMLKSVPVR